MKREFNPFSQSETPILWQTWYSPYVLKCEWNRCRQEWLFIKTKNHPGNLHSQARRAEKRLKWELYKAYVRPLEIWIKNRI